MGKLLDDTIDFLNKVKAYEDNKEVKKCAEKLISAHEASNIIKDIVQNDKEISCVSLDDLIE